jgi:hypothetical protein
LLDHDLFPFFFTSIQSRSYQTGAWIISRGAELAAEVFASLTSLKPQGLVFTSKHAFMGVASFSDFTALSQSHSLYSVRRKMTVNNESEEQ